MKELRGTLRIGGCSGSDSGIRVELIDSLSHCVVVKASVSYEEFGKIMSNLSGECTFTYNDSVVIGMKAEHKTEIVRFTNPSYDRKGPKLDAAMDKALKSFEVDGWKADRDNLLNSHRRAGMDSYNVIFRRHVPAK